MPIPLVCQLGSHPISPFQSALALAKYPTSSTWTDDTSMSLCLTQSLIDTRGTFIPQNVLRNFIQWYLEGYLSAADYCLDIGNGTRTALGIWERWFKVGGGYLGDSEGDVKGHETGLEEIKIVLSGEVVMHSASVAKMIACPLTAMVPPSIAAATAHSCVPLLSPSSTPTLSRL